MEWKMGLKLCSIVLISVLLLAQAQRRKRGRCKNPDPMPNFKEEKFLNKWYYYATTPFYLIADSKCPQVEHFPPKERKWPFTLSWVDSSGEQDNVNSKDLITRPGVGITNWGANYTYLETDENYNKYAIVYLCKNEQKKYYQEILVILTRSKTPDERELSPEISKFIKKGFSVYDLSKTDLSGCPDGAENES